MEDITENKYGTSRLWSCWRLLTPVSLSPYLSHTHSAYLLSSPHTWRQPGPPHLYFGSPSPRHALFTDFLYYPLPLLSHIYSTSLSPLEVLHTDFWTSQVLPISKAKPNLEILLRSCILLRLPGYYCLVASPLHNLTSWGITCFGSIIRHPTALSTEDRHGPETQLRHWQVTLNTLSTSNPPRYPSNDVLSKTQISFLSITIITLQSWFCCLENHRSLLRKLSGFSSNFIHSTSLTNDIWDILKTKSWSFHLNPLSPLFHIKKTHGFPLLPWRGRGPFCTPFPLPWPLYPDWLLLHPSQHPGETPSSLPPYCGSLLCHAVTLHLIIWAVSMCLPCYTPLSMRTGIMLASVPLVLQCTACYMVFEWMKSSVTRNGHWQDHIWSCKPVSIKIPNIFL